jgi:hypothetical protein
MRFRGALSLLFLIALAGCGGDDDKAAGTTVRETVTETATASVPDSAPMVLTVYFLRDGQVAPVQRSVVSSPRVAGAALSELLRGPTSAEEAMGLETAIPAGTESASTSIGNGVARVGVEPVLTERAAQAQLVYTLTQFPTVRRVAFTGGPTLGRKAFEAVTPPILVESPTAGQTVEPGFAVTGTANTFEATFNYELKDASGKVLKKDFVTATSGSGTRGTFKFTVPYEVSEAQKGTLVVYEVSAADGSRTHEVEIPLQLE